MPEMPPMSTEDIIALPGVWMIYTFDGGNELFETAAQAARTAAQQGYGSVGYWPLGVEFNDAVRLWERSA